ncbi:MAG: RNA methyltransferase, partial [Candidatus Poribacteria bacterium]|nr:RNA methyltransferase [Candidatus Poribacteria bacterium]
MTADNNDTSKTMPADEPVERQRAIQVDVPKNLENIRVILFEPREPGNIGSAARALKGMGLSQLYIVNPIPFLDAKPTWYMAHGATVVIENCCVVDTLEEALEGVQFLVGTTHRRRDPKLPPSVSVKEAAQEIAAVSQSQRVALLFGRE